MGPPESGVECGSAHIGGANSIRLDDWREPRRSVSAVRIGSRSSTRAMMTARTAVRCVRYRLWKAHHAVPDCTMVDWDDIRYFLAVARGGSVRAAAERLGVNHSTVLRRVAQLEERLGAHLFEKLPSGYRLTDAGEEVLEFATQMGVVEPARDARLRSRSGRARASAGDAPADPRHAPAHARLRRLCAASPRDRDGDIVHRRAGESD